MGIRLLPPNINASDIEFTIEKDENVEKIRFGLSAIKNVGTSAIDVILSTRQKDGPFVSFTDFVNRVDLSKVNKKTLECLIKTGAFDKFGKRASMLAAYPTIVDRIHTRKGKESQGQDSLFVFEDDSDTIDRFPDVEELSKDELLFFEKELLGFYLTEHPLTRFLPLLEKKVTHRIRDLTNTKSSVILGGLVASVKKIVTRNGGSEMAFVKLDDFTATIELVVFPSVYERTKHIWVSDRVVLIKGKLSEKEDRLTVLVDDAKLVTS
jgi:DNA polymerase-3 subunit alpha